MATVNHYDNEAGWNYTGAAPASTITGDGAKTILQLAQDALASQITGEMATHILNNGASATVQINVNITVPGKATDVTTP